MRHRGLQEVAFSEIRRQLTYKCHWYGKILVTVDRWYASSKICSNCRYTLEELSLDQREWCCPGCGVLHDRDINAAPYGTPFGILMPPFRISRDRPGR